MLVKVVLVDINPKMVAAWRATFEENPEVEIVQGSMLEQLASAWVTPTNGKGSMDGGLDAILKRHFGPTIETKVQREIAREFGGSLPVGHATCVPTGAGMPSFLISTPTMAASSEDISDSLNVVLACAAAFQAVHIQNARAPGSIRSVALPGLGTSTGKVPVEICADLMWTAYNLFRTREFEGFAALRVALEEELGGDLGPSPSPGKGKSKAAAANAKGAAPASSAPAPPAAPTTPSAKAADVDFDDFA